MATIRINLPETLNTEFAYVYRHNVKTTERAIAKAIRKFVTANPNACITITDKETK